MRWFPPIAIPLAVVLVACIVALVLPFRMIEPDDDDFFYGMHAFAQGKVVMTPAEARSLAEIPLPDETKRAGRMATGVRSPKGQIRERSPGHYALLAALHKLGLDRYTNAVLAVAVVAVFFWLARRHLDLGTEAAVLASLLLIVNPTFLTMLYRVYMSDFDYFVWATVSLGLYFAARRTGRVWLCAVAGLTLGLSVAFRNTNAIALLAIGAYEVGRYWLAFHERASAQAGGPTIEVAPPFGWARWAVLGGCLALGLVPLLWYNVVTAGELLGSGYQYRLERQSSAYFALWDAGAVFSLRHLFLGGGGGMMSQGWTLSVGLARVLQGFPLVVLAPAGLVAMERRRLRPALFLALWLGLFWGIYLCYRTIRADSFQFMCRKLSPALAPLAVGAALAVMRLPRRARYVAFATVAIVSLGVTGDFFVRFLGERGPLPNRPGMQRPARDPGAPVRPQGPAMRPALPPGQGRPGRPPGGSDPRQLVQRLHRLMDEARRRGLDVSEAQRLDDASRRAAQRGDWEENRRDLDEAIRLLERALGDEPRRRP